MLDWIPITERMPDDTQDVAVFIPPDRVGDCEIFLATYMPFCLEWNSQFPFSREKEKLLASRITHWAKLNRP